MICVNYVNNSDENIFIAVGQIHRGPAIVDHDPKLAVVKFARAIGIVNFKYGAYALFENQHFGCGDVGCFGHQWLVQAREVDTTIRNN